MIRMELIIGTFIACMFMVIPFSLFIGMNSTITIEQSYLTEYAQCSTKLDSCIESKTPSCSPCECKPGTDGIFNGVISIMFWISGIIMYIVGFRKINKSNNKDKKKGNKK